MNRINCPSCGKRLKYGHECAGKKAKCQKCGTSFQLPSFLDSEVQEAVSHQISCPHCKGRILYDSKLAARVVACPHCRSHLQMPNLDSPASPHMSEEHKPLAQGSNTSLGDTKTKVQVDNMCDAKNPGSAIDPDRDSVRLNSTPDSRIVPIGLCCTLTAVYCVLAATISFTWSVIGLESKQLDGIGSGAYSGLVMFVPVLFLTVAPFIATFEHELARDDIFVGLGLALATAFVVGVSGGIAGCICVLADGIVRITLYVTIWTVLNCCAVAGIVMALLGLKSRRERRDKRQKGSGVALG